MKIEEYEKLNPIVNIKLSDKDLKFHTPNTFTLWRAQTILKKEPATIQWLNKMQNGEHLLDIGANVGTYSIYAAIMRNVSVTAIEPESQNFNLLCKNIRLNQIEPLIYPMSIGLSDESGLSTLNISDFRIGGSCHSLGEEVSFDHKPKKFLFKQGIYSTTVDRLVETENVPMPDHIKLDVDGIEHKIIKGAKQTLANKNVRSLLVELNSNLPAHAAAIDELSEIGFKYDESQVALVKRTAGIFEGFAEYIFYKT